MACRLMGLSLIKKGILGAALGAGALYMVFGTSAPSYVRTAFHKVRDNVKGNVPVQFDIDRARDEIQNLEPAIKEGIAQYVRAETEINDLTAEIASTKANLEKEKVAMQTLNDSLKTGEYRLAGTLTYTADEIKAELERRCDSYKLNAKVVESREATLKAKTKTLAAVRDQLNQMATTRKALLAKLEGIEARLKMIETTRESRDFNFDDSALARAKSTVADLDKRLNEMSRQAELEARYSDTGVPITVKSSRDVVKEVDELLGTPAKKAATDKSL
jgi:septal ring factor EnvC (AmiA/AmiB activator)